MRAKLLIRGVVRAERVTVSEYERTCTEIEQERIVDKVSPGCPGKRSAEEKIAIAAHDVQ